MRSEFVGCTINGWLDSHCDCSRWRGREDEIREQLEGCICRYRYSDSFLGYVFRTLEYARWGIVSFRTCSLNEPIPTDARERNIANIVRDPETNEITSYRPRKVWTVESNRQLVGWKRIAADAYSRRRLMNHEPRSNSVFCIRLSQTPTLPCAACGPQRNPRLAGAIRDNDDVGLH